MADDKSGRDKQAHDAKRRRQERDIATALERGDESEPPIPAGELGDLEAELDELAFPVTGIELVQTIGDRTIESAEGRFRIEELVPATDDETFDSPDAVRVQIERPTVAAAMKRVVEASKTLRNTEFKWTQRKAYEKTFEELRAVDEEDDDAGIRAIADWIVERVHDKESLPSSRGVRREAAKYCRANGYQIRTDEWLGI